MKGKSKEAKDDIRAGYGSKKDYVIMNIHTKKEKLKVFILSDISYQVNIEIGPSLF